MHGVISYSSIQEQASYSLARQAALPDTQSFSVWKREKKARSDIARQLRVASWRRLPLIGSAAFLVALMLFFALPSAAHAATLFWVGTDGADANVASNWKTTNPTTCGSGDASAIPGASDTMQFDADCDSGAVLSADMSVTTFNLATGYIGTIDMNGHNLTVTGNVSQAGTTNVLKTSGGTLRVDGTYTLSGSGTLDGDDGSFDLNNVTGSAGGTGNIIAPTGAFTISGTVSFANTGLTFTHSNGTVTFDGTTATQTFRSNGEIFYNVTHTGSQTLQLITTSLTVDGAFTNSGSGAFDPATNSWNLTAAGLVTVSNGQFQAGSGTHTFNGGLTISGGTYSGSTSTTDVNGSLTLSSGTLTAPSGTFTVSGNWAVSGSPTFTPGSNTVTLDGTSGTIDITSAGTSFNNLTINDGGGSATYEVEDTMDVNGNLTITGGTLDTKSGEDNSITVAGNWSNADTFTARSGIVTLDGTSGTLDLVSGGSSFNNLTFNDGGGSATFEVEDTLDVNGNLTITGGTVDVKSDENNGITVGGNWSNSDAFTARSGTVTFDGTNQTISGTNTFYALTKNEGTNDSTNSTWTFPAGVTTTVTNAWTVDGLDSNDKIALASSSGGTRWNIDPQGTRTIDNATVTDSNNTHAMVINEFGDSTVTSGGNNLNWIFASTNPFTWIGTTTTWATGTNWAGGSAPGTGDTAVFDGATSSANAMIGADINVGGISIESDYTGTITQAAAITIGSGNYAQAAGTFTGGSGAIDLNGTFNLSGGTFTGTSGTMTVSDSWTDTGTFTPNNGTVTFDGTSAKTITTTGSSFYNVNFTDGGTDPTYTLQDTLDADNALTIGSGATLDTNSGGPYAITVGGSWSNGGTFTARSGTVTLDGAGSSNSITPGSSNFNNLTISGSGAWDAAAALTISSTLTLSNGILDLSGFNLSAGSFTTGGTLRLVGTETSVTSPSNLSTAGTIAYDNTATLSSFLLGNTYYNLTLSGSGTVQLAAALDVNNALTVGSGATLDFNSANLTLGGNFANSGTLSNTGTRTLTVDNTSGTQTIDIDNATFAALIVSGGGGTASLTSDMTIASDVTIASGDTLNIATGIALTSNGTITNGATISESGTGKIVDLASSFYIADNNFDEAGAISLGTDKIYFSITDEDANVSGGSPDTISNAVTVTCANGAFTDDSETVSLTETGSATEVFRYTTGINTAQGDSSVTTNDGTLECQDGETITATYTDPQDNTDTKQDTSTATTDTLPTAPSSFAGSVDSATAITWTWTDNAANEDGFKLLDTSNNVIATIATVNATSYQETGLSTNTSYTRKVVAYNDAGNSTASNTDTKTTADNGAPTPPTSLAGTALSSTVIRWTWTDASDDETQWVLQDSDGTTIATITSTTEGATGATISYDETGLTPHTSYTRKVAAKSSLGTSSATSEVLVTTLRSQPDAFSLISPANGALLATGLPTFTWAKTTDDDDGMDYYLLVLDNNISLHIPKDGASSSNPGAHTHYADGFMAQYFNENDGDEGNDTIAVTVRIDASDRFPLDDDSYTWHVTAYDTAGNSRSTSSRTFTVDTAAPLVTAMHFNVTTTQKSGTYRLLNTTPTITLTLTDRIGLAQATATLEEGVTTLGILTSYTARQTTTYALTGTRGTIAFTPRTALRAGGNYRLRVVARDTAGNERETTILMHVLTAQEAARAELSELNADTAPVDTIVDRLRETLPESLFSLPDFTANALLRRQKEAAAFTDFLLQLRQSRLAQLFLMNRGLLTRPFLALWDEWEYFLVAGTQNFERGTQFAHAAMQRMNMALADQARSVLAFQKTLRQINNNAQNNIRQGIVAALSEAEDAADRVATTNSLFANPTARFASVLHQWATWAATSPRIGQDNTGKREQTGTVVANIGAQARTVGNAVANVWQIGRDTRVREGLRNRQRIEGALTRLLTPLQRGSKGLATRMWATYEIWTDKEPTRISNVRVTSLTPTTAVIEWDTNHFTRSAAVNYGTSTSYGQKIAVDELTNRHRIEIVNLTPTTTYYFEIMNQNGDYVYDAYYTLTTPETDAPLSGTLEPQDARLLKTTEARETPEPNAAVLTTLPAGTLLRALTEQGMWISVLLPSGAQGWVLREAVELLPQAEQHSAEAQHISRDTE